LPTVSTVGPQDDGDMSPMPPKVETSGYILKKIPKQYIEK